MIKKQKHRIRHYPPEFRGQVTNRYGGNKLQRERGLRGTKLGPANQGRAYTEDERQAYERAMRERGDLK